MTNSYSPRVVQCIGLIWLLSTPLLWLGAALSKMETSERYNAQLAIFTVICLLAIGASIGSFNFLFYPWARRTLILLSWVAALFWLASGYFLWLAGDPLAIFIGLCYTAAVVLLHRTDGQPSIESWAAA